MHKQTVTFRADGATQNTPIQPPIVALGDNGSGTTTTTTSSSSSATRSGGSNSTTSSATRTTNQTFTRNTSIPAQPFLTLDRNPNIDLDPITNKTLIRSDTSAALGHLKRRIDIPLLPDDIPLLPDTPATQPTQENPNPTNPDTPQGYTLLGVTLQPLHWILLGLATPLISLLTIKQARPRAEEKKKTTKNPTNQKKLVPLPPK